MCRVILEYFYIDIQILAQHSLRMNELPTSRRMQVASASVAMSGVPDPKLVGTSFVARQNLTMRKSMHGFARLTNDFSKKLGNNGHALALNLLHYNVARVHKTLHVTSACMLPLL